MRSFDFYEFVGVIVPGGFLLAGIVWCLPADSVDGLRGGLSFGDASFAVILAYGFGHLIQAIGNAIEAVWWKTVGGLPSDWPRSGKRHLLTATQIRQLRQCLKAGFAPDLPETLSKMARRDWHVIIRQVYAAVSGAGRASRVDVFNGNYGLLRGLAASLLAIIIVRIVLVHPTDWSLLALLGAGFGIAVYRMHRFGVHYARELFVQYLALNSGFQAIPEGNGEKHGKKKHGTGPDLAD